MLPIAELFWPLFVFLFFYYNLMTSSGCPSVFGSLAIDRLLHRSSHTISSHTIIVNRSATSHFSSRVYASQSISRLSLSLYTLQLTAQTQQPMSMLLIRHNRRCSRSYQFRLLGDGRGCPVAEQTRRQLAACPIICRKQRRTT